MKISKLTKDQFEEAISTTRGRKRHKRNVAYYKAVDDLNVKEYFSVPNLVVGTNIRNYCKNKYPDREYRVIKYGKSRKPIVLRIS